MMTLTGSEIMIPPFFVGLPGAPQVDQPLDELSPNHAVFTVRPPLDGNDTIKAYHARWKNHSLSEFPIGMAVFILICI